MVATLVAQHNIPLSSSKNAIGGRKAEETKAETKKKVVVRRSTQALFLQNNEVRTIVGLPEVLVDVMYNSANLVWLDLSYNYLENIEDTLQQFTQLKTLYLHGNFFTNIDQVKLLNQFEDLQTLTLYGNPIESIQNYRLWVLGVMYQYSENLRRLDQVLVTNREFDKVLVWRENLFSKKRLRTLKPQNTTRKPPPLPKSEEEEKKQAGGQ